MYITSRHALILRRLSCAEQFHITHHPGRWGIFDDHAQMPRIFLRMDLQFSFGHILPFLEQIWLQVRWWFPALFPFHHITFCIWDDTITDGSLQHQCLLGGLALSIFLRFHWWKWNVLPFRNSSTACTGFRLPNSSSPPKNDAFFLKNQLHFIGDIDFFTLR